MTIEYINKTFPPPPYDVELETIQFYRDLYDGNHEEIFPRAQTLQESVQKPVYFKSGNRYIKSLRHANKQNNKAMYHYISVNFSAVIAELPADLISRALGNISADTETDSGLLEFIPDVVKRSKLQKSIRAAVLQHQVDGGVAYRIRRNDQGAYFEWKPMDLYLPHDDDLGADIAWIEEHGDTRKKEKFLRVERQRIEESGLVITQHAFNMEGNSVGDEIDVSQYGQDYGIIIPEDNTLNGVTELMCGFIPNDETLLNPRGLSALRNCVDIQDEINWTITRDSIVFEKHGKPKLAIPRKLWDTVANTNQNYYGARFVRNADLEVVSYDENNGAIPMYITWDGKTEESFKHVERLIRYMLSITKTSPQSVGLSEGGSKSAIAILYEWIQTIMKTEAIQDKFDRAIKEAIKKCTILENALGGTVYKEVEPVVEWQDMVPKADSERDSEEIEKYREGVQSLEVTIRKIHPDWSEEAIQEEMTKIQEEQAVDSFNPTFSQPPRVQLGDE